MDFHWHVQPKAGTLSNVGFYTRSTLHPSKLTAVCLDIRQVDSRRNLLFIIWHPLFKGSSYPHHHPFLLCLTRTRLSLLTTLTTICMMYTNVIFLSAMTAMASRAVASSSVPQPDAPIPELYRDSVLQAWDNSIIRFRRDMTQFSPDIYKNTAFDQAIGGNGYVCHADFLRFLSWPKTDSGSMSLGLLTSAYDGTLTRP